MPDAAGMIVVDAGSCTAGEGAFVAPASAPAQAPASQAARQVGLPAVRPKGVAAVALPNLQGWQRRLCE